MLLNEAKELFPEESKTAPENAIGYIYITFEPISGSFYLGKQTCKKWRESYYGSGRFPLQWIKIGLHLDHWPIQWCFSKEELNQAEFDWIDKFKDHCDIKNIMAGGEKQITPINEKAKKIFKEYKGTTKGYHLSEEHKRKLSESHKEYYKSHNGVFKGKHHTEESKQKMSQSQTKRFKERGSECKGMHHTEESKQHMSEGCKKYYETHDAPMKGKHHNQETKKLISEKVKEKMNDPNFKHPNSRPVRCIETGIIYKSAIDATRSLGEKNGHIHEVCNGKRKKALGYHWEWIKKE